MAQKQRLGGKLGESCKALKLSSCGLGQQRAKCEAGKKVVCSKENGL